MGRLSWIADWIMEWFNPNAFNAGNGVSMGRRLAAFTIITLDIALLVVAIRTNTISAPWAAVAGTIVGFLQLTWTVGKINRKDDEAPKC